MIVPCRSHPIPSRYRCRRLPSWLIALTLLGAPVSMPLGSAQTIAAVAPEQGGPESAPHTEASRATTAGPAIQGRLPAELSAWTMYRDADWVVKTVMLLLLAASLMCWTIAFAKALELRRTRKKIQRQNIDLQRAESLAITDRTHLRDTPAGMLLAAVDDELRRSGDGGPDGKAGIKERAALQLRRLEMAFSRRLALGTGLLASVGATAPFVGLFGTVWGIMNAFIGISRTQTTSLAVVAPGIAEALLATALGLAAAIPAVLLYNYFSRKIAHLRALLGDQSAQIMQLLSRDLDRAHDHRRGRSA